MLKQYVKLNSYVPKFIAVSTAVIWLLIFAGTLAVMVLGKPDTLALLYSAFVIPISTIFPFIFCLCHSKTYFDLALGFGRTRKQALGLILGHSLLLALVACGGTLFFYLLDRFLTPRVVVALLGLPGFYPIGQGTGIGLPVELITPPFWFFLLPFAGAILGLTCGALVRRFGAKAGGILYVLFMMLILSWNSEASWLMDHLPLVVTALVAAAAAAAVWAIRDLLHTPIRC